MCGLAGIVAEDPPAPECLEAMTEALVHRGPDGAGHWYEGPVALGHRRLAILDLSPRGAQPMHYRDRYVIAHNGEVYNYLEIRRDLEREGYRFESSTDTEVIVAAYDRWGVRCLDRFNGMWAFAIVDRRDRTAFIARDRLGVKPLYFAHCGRQFLFASETKALLKHPSMSRQPDVEYCRRYLVSGPREYGAGTAWQGIRRLENASYIHCSWSDLAAGRFATRSYWSLQPTDADAPFDERRAASLAGDYLDLLRSAVELRLRSDVKIGSALSGGLDSSSIVYLVNQGLARAGVVDMQETFSCVYRSPGTEDCDESLHINAIAAALRVKSNQIEPQVADVPAAHREMIYYLDSPPESSLMSSWHTFKLVGRTDVTVTLDGQGADEQLAGYPRYVVPYLAYSESALRDARALFRLPGFVPFVGVGLASRLTRALGVGGVVPFALRRAKKQIFDGSPLNASLAHDTLQGLQNLIHYADRTSMAFSIESRMPFLDVRLVEFLAQIPASYKIHEGWTKYLARRALDGLLPKEIVWRRDKMGWPIPEAFWFRGTLRNWYRHEIESSSFLKELDVCVDVDRLIHRARGIGATTRLLNLATWYRVHVEHAWRPEGLLSDRAAGRGVNAEVQVT